MVLTFLLRAALTSLCLAVAAPVVSGGEAAKVMVRPLADFKIGSSETKFGRLDYLGGLELYSTKHLFGAISAIRFRPDGNHFVSVLDTGHWLTGTVSRDAKGRLAGMQDAVITPMKDASGGTYEGKGRMDAEGMVFRGKTVLVSFEQKHRVEAYPAPGFEDSPSIRSIPILISPKSLSGNRGLEAIAVSPETSALAGATVVVSERSLDRHGNLYAAILDGPKKGQFSVRPDGAFDVTDGAFLPNGDLLLLERRFNIASGVGMRLRLIKNGAIVAGAVVDGDVLLDTDMTYQIDNMEGLDAFRAADGTTHIVMVSDDNHSLLQRNVMLEFRLRD